MINPAFLIDGYKVGHREQYPEGTQLVFSNSTARESRMAGVDKMVVFGLQYFIKDVLIDLWNKNFFQQPKQVVCKQYHRLISKYLFTDVTVKHIEDLHDLGYLPLAIMSLPEGTKVPMRLAHTVFYNTKKEFFWLTNFFETIYSAQTWDMNTAATIAYHYREVFNKYADETVGNRDFVPWQGHDFSFRGRPNWQSAMASGAGHLLSFYGTDTIPALWFLEEYYNADVTKEIIGGSVPATEHSVMCVGTGYNDITLKDQAESELDVFRRLITEVYPSGVVSIVSDTWDFWRVITDYTVTLKSEILARNGKVVFRPDSGDPVKIICGDPNAPKDSPAYKGAIECLWEVFGGAITEKGYKLLDGHVGLIYGDSITLARQVAILEGLKRKGFASFNVVLGIGLAQMAPLRRNVYRKILLIAGTLYKIKLLQHNFEIMMCVKAKKCLIYLIL
jgi:nicotinamide phosphoribosyltransferase